MMTDRFKQDRQINLNLFQKEIIMKMPRRRKIVRLVTAQALRRSRNQPSPAPCKECLGKRRVGLPPLNSSKARVAWGCGEADRLRYV